MKGVPEAPQCGFSRTVAKVLEMYEVPPQKMKSYNVLEDPELRTAIKEFSFVLTSLPRLPVLTLENLRLLEIGQRYHSSTSMVNSWVDATSL
jgi:glutaredoxin-related protein